MDGNAHTPKSYITPWTLRVYDALPGNPVSIGIGFACILLVVFFVGRILADGASGSSPGDLRLVLIHILLTAYTASAYVHLLNVAHKSADELAQAVRVTSQRQTTPDKTGKHLWWGLALSGMVGVLTIVYSTIMTTAGEDLWDWQRTNYDARWMRLLGVFLGSWAGCLLYVLVVESARLSRLSDSIESLDLLDMQPYQPLIRQGLTNALLVVGMASVLSLFLLEPGFVSLLVQLSLVLIIFAWIGLMLPLAGIRRKISVAKNEELTWCRRTLKKTRDQLKSGADSRQSIAEVIAYRTMIENIRNWPFDNPSLTRFALYLLIPLGSMLGGALVERGLNLFFP